MDVIDFNKFREEVVSSIYCCETYIEWAQHLEKILEKLQPNPKICEIIMDLSIKSQYRRDYFVDFASWLCSISDEYRRLYEQIFQNIYETVFQEEIKPNHHRIYEETKFFAILFSRDSISWNILSCVELKENSCSYYKEYFVTLLLLEMSRNLGNANLSARLMDPNLQRNLAGLFPKDKLENTLYAIKMFELVNLQALAQNLQEYVNRSQDDELTFGVEKMSL